MSQLESQSKDRAKHGGKTKVTELQRLKRNAKIAQRSIDAKNAAIEFFKSAVGRLEKKLTRERKEALKLRSRLEKKIQRRELLASAFKKKRTQLLRMLTMARRMMAMRKGCK